MQTYLNGRIGRTTTRVLLATAIAAGAAAGVSQTAFAASKPSPDPFCPVTDPSTGFSDPTCVPPYYGGGGGGGGSTSSADVVAFDFSSYDAPLGTGSYVIKTTGGLYRSGTHAASPTISLTTSFSSTSLFGFHGCVDAVAKSGGATVWDSGTRRVGVDGGGSYTLSYGTGLSVAAAASVKSFAVTQWQC